MLNPVAVPAKANTPPIELSPPAWLLMGPSGTGKSHAITTLLKAGLEVFYLATEPDAVSVVLEVIRKEKLDFSKFHWHSIKSASSGMPALIDMAKKVRSLDFKGITNLEVGIGKDKQNQFIELLTSISSFVDDKDGTNYGDATTWDTSRALVIDSMSGINHMAWKLVVGLRPTASQGEWGVAQNTVYDLMMELISNCKCFFIVTAHIEREQDEVTGGTKITVSSLGRKLAPRLPPIFSEVILSKRDGTKFTWSNMAPQTDLKARLLPWSNDLEPTFVPLVKAYKALQTLAATGGVATK